MNLSFIYVRIAALNGELLERAASMRRERVPFCMATIVDARGSIPQIVGARALFTRQGLAFGTVGGGRLETKCIETASQLLGDAVQVRTRFERLNLFRDIGMTCAGEVSVYFEAHRPDLDWHVVVFGAGHVAQKLCRFLVELDCRVTCIDTRAEWLERLPRSPALEAVPVECHADGIGRIEPHSVVVVMTMGHATDLPVLRAIEAGGSPPGYLGVIGSKSKARILRRDLLRAGSDPAFASCIVCPIGDKVGDNTPGEIAVGIVSQLVRERSRVRCAPAG